MSGAKKEHVKIILQTIENGTLSEAETERRLLGLVRQEAERKDRPADLYYFQMRMRQDARRIFRSG